MAVVLPGEADASVHLQRRRGHPPRPLRRGNLGHRRREGLAPPCRDPPSTQRRAPQSAHSRRRAACRRSDATPPGTPRWVGRTAAWCVHGRLLGPWLDVRSPPARRSAPLRCDRWRCRRRHAAPPTLRWTHVSAGASGPCFPGIRSGTPRSRRSLPGRVPRSPLRLPRPHRTPARCRRAAASRLPHGPLRRRIRAASAAADHRFPPPQQAEQRLRCRRMSPVPAIDPGSRTPGRARRFQGPAHRTSRPRPRPPTPR